ncbi:MAG TPA: hypothetical protein VEZ70_13695 [Allosphingosinicella sp.]|nr:hypothetical protein [Allosphingosinicella sp.]
MTQPSFFVFTPVPLRRRCDGWTPELQLRFVRLLAEGVKPGEAARLVGRNRQNAYALRKRAGAESFAAAWDAAAALGAARRRRASPRPRGARPAPPPPPPPAAPARHLATPAAISALGRLAASYPRPSRSARQGAAKSDNSDNSDKGGAPRSRMHAIVNLMNFAPHTVAFHTAGLRAQPC